MWEGDCDKKMYLISNVQLIYYYTYGFSFVQFICATALLTGTELSVMSTREREKGNEAYRAGDYLEALQLYSTSIAMDGDFNAYNNRAMTREYKKLCTI